MSFLKGAAKAVTAAVVPLLSTVVTQVIADLEVAVSGIVAAAVTALMVYLVPNKTS